MGLRLAANDTVQRSVCVWAAVVVPTNSENIGSKVLVVWVLESKKLTKFNIKTRGRVVAGVSLVSRITVSIGNRTLGVVKCMA